MKLQKSLAVFIITFAASLTLVGCNFESHTTNDQRLDDAGFFENTLRRSATDSDVAAKAIVKLGDCTAFFVSNNAGKALLISAQHCVSVSQKTETGNRFNTAFTQRWCQSQKVFDPQIAQERSCTRMIYASPTSDIILFEVSGPRPSHTLQINASVPQKSTRLQTLGYPSDPHKKPGLNVSENCWVTDPEADPEAVPKLVRFDGEKHFAHNCSVYGGNSGGPIVVEGTSEVVALPSSFTRNDFVNRDSRTNKRAMGTALSLRPFVASNQELLRAEKISFTNQLPRSSRITPTIPLVSGFYACEGLKDWRLLIKARYNTDDRLQKITWWWQENGKSEFQWETDVDCSVNSQGQTECLETGNSKTYVVQNPMHDKFVLINPNDRGLHKCTLTRPIFF